MQLRFKYLLFAAALFLFASCKKKNTQGRLIPATAAFVLQVDGKSLASKLPWDEIKNNPVFKEAYGDSSLPASVKKLLDNPASSGIDLSKDLLVFVLKDSIGGYIGFEGSVKDEAMFKSFNTEVSENGSASEKDGINFISKFPVCVGWDKEKFVYIIDAPQLGQMDQLSKRMMRDSIDISNHNPRDIGATCKSVFALSESNSLAVNEQFTKVLAESGDIRFWLSTEALSKGGGSNTPEMLALIDLSKLYKDSYTTGVLNFENGKVTANLFSYAGKELTAVYKKYGGGKIDEDMLKRMPGKDVVAVMALHFQPEGIRELLKVLNLDGFVNVAVSRFGFNMDDFVKANKGDILVGVTDFKLEADTSTFAFKDEEQFKSLPATPKANFVFAASIGDKDAFNKLINAGKKAGSSLPNAQSGELFAYNSNGTYFALGNSKETVDKYLAGSDTKFDFISNISGSPFGGYLNLQSLMKSLQTQASKDSAGKALFDISLSTWDNVLWKGGEFKNDALTNTIEINLVDKNTNSLKQLAAYLSKAAKVAMEKKKKQQEDMRAFEDAITPGNLDGKMPPPPPPAP